MRAPMGSTQQFGDVRVTIDGPAEARADAAHRWVVLALRPRWAAGATSLARFTVTPHSSAAVEETIVVSIGAPADPSLLVALVRTVAHTFAVPASRSADSGAEWVFDATGGPSAVQVLALSDDRAVAACVDWFGGAPGMGAGPEPAPAPEPGLEVGSIIDETYGTAGVSGGGGPTSGSRGPSTPMFDLAPADLVPADLAPVDEQPNDAAAESPEAESAAAAGPSAPTVIAHVAAEMPRTARVGEVVTLDVRLGREKITATDGLESDEGIFAAVEGLPVAVSITLRGYRLVSGSPTRTAPLPRRRTARRRFLLEATDEGSGEVSIVVRQGGENPLATLRLTTTIGDARDPDPARASVTPRASDPELDGLPIIRIDESVSRGQSSLDIAVSIGDDSIHVTMRDLDKATIVADAYRGIDDLRGRLDDDESGDVDARVSVALDELRRIGVDLSRRLFPLRVRRFLWAHRNELDGLVIQTTGEFDVPWELVYVSDPDRSAASQDTTAEGFLGMLGVTRWVHNTALAAEVTVSRRRANYLCPTYLDRSLSLTFTAAERDLMRRMFRAKSVRPGDADAMSKVIAAGFDLLHFGGHGMWSTDPPDQRLLFAKYRRIGTAPAGSSYSASDLRAVLPDLEMVGDAGAHRMVFLNACDVGRMDTSTPGLGGFPEAFLRGGVGVLVGCSWAIDDEAAGQFVRDFYDALAETHIAGAIVLARRKALANADITALAYVAYAHPHARVVPV